MSEGESHTTTETHHFIQKAKGIIIDDYANELFENRASSSSFYEEGFSQLISNSTTKLLFDLPPLVTDKIFSYLTYDDIAKTRMVSTRFNDYAKNALNRGFNRLGASLESAKAAVKRELPRRESQRRTHRLAKLNEVYAALDTRYALLTMTYKKFMSHLNPMLNTCFIPGKVLDEFFRVMNILQRCKSSGGQFTGDITEILKDVRDLSSMAMEHYEEQVQPGLENAAEEEGVSAGYFGNRSVSRTPVISIPSIRSVDGTPRQNNASDRHGSPVLRDFRKTIEDKVDALQKKVRSQDRVIQRLEQTTTALFSFLEKVCPNNSQELEELKQELHIAEESGDEGSFSPWSEEAETTSQKRHKRIFEDCEGCSTPKKKRTE
ncbi:unnamed protein product [Caenorhabditis auriculariae]|uniref:F-box domain-containing protein n=1 Tax=Caenorhabditis auriculariae TaxID=2777116 RepID=A0A8S1GY36_9PELO|nr:unnamed protein product [Caenorhabditis auriculariae]